MDTPLSRKFGKAMVWGLMLTWLLWGPNLFSSCWWGPALCLGQTASGPAAQHPESLQVGAFSGSNIIGSGKNKGNTLTEINSHLSVELTSSFQGFTGIAQVNQAAGSLNNQANIMSIGASQGRGFTQAGTSYQSRDKDNTTFTSGNDYQTKINGNSFAGGTGVIMVNQAAGNLNTQLNAFNLSFGAKSRRGGPTGLTDSELAAVKANYATTQDPTAPNRYNSKLDVEGGAVKNFTGLVSTNQVAGNKNQVSTFFNVNIQTVP